MFCNIKAELARNGWTLRVLSENTQIQYDSLRNKMNGRTEFTRSEMLKVKHALSPSSTLDVLFAEDGAGAGQEDKAV